MAGQSDRHPGEAPDVAARAAVQDLREVREAYLVVETLLDNPAPTALPLLMIERDRMANLMRIINRQFVAHLARAEEALAAC